MLTVEHGAQVFHITQILWGWSILGADGIYDLLAKAVVNVRVLGEHIDSKRDESSGLWACVS